MNIENLIVKNLGPKFEVLKLLEIVYSKPRNTCTISFLYPETSKSISPADKTAISEVLTPALGLNAPIVVKLQKSYLENSLIHRAVLSFFKTSRASLASVITEKSISVNVDQFGVNVAVVFPQSIFESLSLSALETDLVTYLNSKFIAEFYFKFSSGESLNFAQIEEGIQNDIAARAKMVKPTNRYKVFDVFKLIGKDITPEPEYLADIKGAKQSVILAGRIQNFEKKTYKRVRNEKEVEKTYYKFMLKEGSRSIQMVYFCPKANILKMDKLVDGTDILVIADIKKDGPNLSAYIRDLSLCQINDVVYNHNKEKITTYQLIHPQRYEIYSQGNIFDAGTKYNDNITNNTFVVFDVETTGLDADECEIIEIGAVKVSGGHIIEKFQTLVKPKKPIPSIITKITSITNQMVKDAPPIEPVIKDFFLFCKNTILSGYNVNFDVKFIQAAARQAGFKFENQVQDTMTLARQKVSAKNYKLETIVKTLNLSLDNAHRAFFDALATAQVLLELSKVE